MIRVLTAIALFIGTQASAEPAVELYWRHLIANPDGTTRAVTPSNSFFRRMNKCGITPDLTQVDKIELSKLDCDGLLDFSRSNEFISNLLQYLPKENSLKLNQFKKEIQKLRFAISPQATFVSRIDGISINPRILGINIQRLNLVIFNKVMLKKLPTKNSLNPVLLHEALVALGYQDTQYEITSNYVAYGKLNLKRSDSSKSAAIYIVGHGGETTGLYFKSSLIDALRQQKLTISFEKEVPEKYRPSPEYLIDAITHTDVTLAPAAKMMSDYDVCDSWDENEKGPQHCGGYVAKGAEGKPFLLISEEWGTFPTPEQNHALIMKIYLQLYRESIYALGFKP